MYNLFCVVFHNHIMETRAIYSNVKNGNENISQLIYAKIEDQKPDMLLSINIISKLKNIPFAL